MSDHYTLSFRDGCVIATTPNFSLPAEAIPAIRIMVGSDAIADPLLAKALNAKLVMGKAGHLSALRRSPEALASGLIFESEDSYI